MVFVILIIMNYLRNKVVLFPVLVLAAIFAWFFFLKNVPDIANYPGSGESIVFLGDSLTAGYGSTDGNDYVSLIGQKTRIPVVNLGRNGDTTESALARIDEVVAAKPKLVVVYLGGNDYLRRVPIEKTFSNLEWIIIQIQDSGSMVAIIGSPGGVIGDPYADRYEALAERYKTIYIPQFIKSIILDRSLMHDGIHPNDLGYKIVADKIWEGIEDFIY